MRTLITRTAIALATTACLFSTASAGEKYILVSGGGSTFSDNLQADTDAKLVALGLTGVQSTVGTNSSGYKLFLGYQFNPNFAVEGGFIDLGSRSYTATHATGTLTMDNKVTGYNVSALGISPINADLSIFGKAGLTIASVKGSGSSGAVSVTTSEDKNNLGFGVGLTYQLNDKIGLRTEVERIATDMNLFSLGLQIKY